MSPDPGIDPKALELLRSLEQDRPGAMTELVRLFVADAPVQMQNVEDGYRDRDGDKVRQAAHFLRSGALALGMSGLIEAAGAVEQQEVAGFGSAEADAGLDRLRVQSRDAIVALLGIVQSL
jgi:HPt (histidine-containing phosphotransfer) domain-containing protein